MDDGLFAVLLAATAAAGVAALFFWWRTRRFLSRAARGSGRITQITREVHESMSYGGDHPSESTTWYTPHVEFPIEDGSLVRFTSRVSHPRSSLYEMGQAVTVVYDRTSPATTAEIEGAAVWRPAIFAAIATLLLLLFTAFGKACA